MNTRKGRQGASLAEKATATLRERIFACEPGTLIGSLHQLARALEVGIVTLQQAARVLEHEGLLEVRRGPGGGYYGTRPDDAALERALDSFMRENPGSFDEALDMTSLLFTELASTAASCVDPALRAQLAGLHDRIAAMDDTGDIGLFEEQFQELLFRMVRRPLFELLTRVTLHYASSRPGAREDASRADPAEWRKGRQQIIAAILANDPELARLEANRRNRAIVLARLARLRAVDGAERN